MTRRVQPPSGLGLYLRGDTATLYPDGREATVSLAAPTWVAVLSRATDDAEILRYQARGIAVYLWEGIDEWNPGRWQETRRSLAARVRRLRLRGYIADVEDAPAWSGEGAELRALTAALAADGRTMSVGVSSFPSHPVWRAAARYKASLWANPQLYGIAHRSSPAIRRQGLAYVEGLMGRATVAAAAWGRDGAESAAYLAEWASRASVIFWTATFTRARALELRAWALASSVGALPALAAALALVALVALLRTAT